VVRELRREEKLGKLEAQCWHGESEGFRRVNEYLKEKLAWQEERGV